MSTHSARDAIRDLAYRLWEKRGRPDGDADSDWFEAEHLLNEPATREASPRNIDDSLKDTFPASDPPASHLPDEPPVNAEAKWAAAARRLSQQERKPRKGAERSN